MIANLEGNREPRMPFSPAEALEAKIESIPDVVIDIFNSLISQHYNGNGASSFYKRIAADKIEQSGLSKIFVIDLDFWCIQEIYAAAGWEAKCIDVGGPDAYDHSYKYVFKRLASEE